MSYNTSRPGHSRKRKGRPAWIRECRVFGRRSFLRPPFCTQRVRMLKAGCPTLEVSLTMALQPWNCSFFWRQASGMPGIWEVGKSGALCRFVKVIWDSELKEGWDASLLVHVYSYRVLLFDETVLCFWGLSHPASLSLSLFLCLCLSLSSWPPRGCF